tara:strand:- start:2948 stop:3913 length:966 start_codon:yes stop_codon:yes gene_type:complete
MKHGSFSVILSNPEYSKIGFKNDEDHNSLLKLSRYSHRHNGELSVIDVLSNDNSYTMKIYKDTIKTLKTEELSYLRDEFRDYFEKHNIPIFILPITHFKVYFIDDLGGIDLFDILSNLVCLEENIWENETELKLIMFIEQMCSALNYFQECKIGHFDIKPENIVYNDNESILPFSKKFKIIDFGFSEYYPFEKARRTCLGTEFYMPANLKKPYPEWAVKNNPNDWRFDYVTRNIYHYIEINNADYNLMYKNDVYSMGITINHLLFYIKFYFKEKQLTLCNTSKIEKLILKMIYHDIEKRYFGYQCLEYLENMLNKKVCCFF